MLSVVVTTFNRREILARSLQALAEQGFPSSQYEVIVVIDGSTDGTQEFLRTLHFGPTLRVIDQPNCGLAAARNAGLQAANHEVVLFLDDDSLCSPQVLAEHEAAHKETDNLLAFGPVLVSPSPSEGVAARITRTHYADSIYGPLARGEPPTWPVHARVPPNSSIAKDLLLHLGGFDERFVNAHEDIELGIRLWRNGVRFRYLPNAQVEHVYTKSEKDLAVGEGIRAGKCEVMLCRTHSVYRSHSLLAASQNSRLFRTGAGDVLLRYAAARTVFDGAVSMTPYLKVCRDRFLGLEGNLNLLRSAVREAGSWASFRAEFWMRLPVLLYHNVGWFKRGAYPGLTVPPDQFASHMQWLAQNGYTPICSSDWLAWCKCAKTLPPKPVLITFDDAYADLVEYALPILRAHGFRAVIFVPTAYVGGSNIWDQTQGRPALMLMTAQQIRQWTAEGIEFGAHSRTHPELEHASDSALQEEVTGSRADLEEISGAPVLAFAYPYGSYNWAVRNKVERSFRLAFTTEEGLNNLGTDPLLLYRTMVQPADSLPEFASRVRFGFSIPERVEAALRRFIGAHR